MTNAGHHHSPRPEGLPVQTTDDFNPPTLPKSHHLVIATPGYVCSLSENGIAEIFRSGSKGIVAAKRARDGSGQLAVADSQVVVLHDVKKGQQRSYRLKGAQVCSRSFPVAESKRSSPALAG